MNYYNNQQDEEEEEEEIDKYNDIYSKLNQECEYFYFINSIERINKPSSLDFYKNYVAMNKPVIITGLTLDWKANQLWTDEYLKNVLNDTQVTVSITPDGFADAVKPMDPLDDQSELVFVKPYEKKIKFQEYINITDSLDSNGKSKDGLIYYMQYQNNSFSIEYQKLWNDITSSVKDFGEQVFGEQEMDAVNFWAGMDDAVSSLHKDPYENLYVVIKGKKIFTLLPPTDYPFLYEREFKSATYFNNNENDPNKPIDLEIKLDVPQYKIPWIPVDPNKPINENISNGYPLIERCHPIQIEVNEGEVLYLPSLYYHRVAQKSNKSSGSNSTIAINYWFNMKYNLNYCYFQFLKNLNNYNFIKK